MQGWDWSVMEFTSNVNGSHAFSNKLGQEGCAFQLLFPSQEWAFILKFFSVLCLTARIYKYKYMFCFILVKCRVFEQNFFYKITLFYYLWSMSRHWQTKLPFYFLSAGWAYQKRGVLDLLLGRPNWPESEEDLWLVLVSQCIIL